MPLFEEEKEQEDAPKKQIFYCFVCKKPYSKCQCYARCPKCECVYLKKNLCNSKKCLGKA